MWTMPADWAARHIRPACAASKANGFSQRTDFPARIAARTISS